MHRVSPTQRLIDWHYEDSRFTDLVYLWSRVKKPTFHLELATSIDSWHAMRKRYTDQRKYAWCGVVLSTGALLTTGTFMETQQDPFWWTVAFWASLLMFVGSALWRIYLSTKLAARPNVPGGSAQYIEDVWALENLTGLSYTEMIRFQKNGALRDLARKRFVDWIKGMYATGPPGLPEVMYRHVEDNLTVLNAFGLGDSAESYVTQAKEELMADIKAAKAAAA